MGKTKIIVAVILVFLGVLIALAFAGYLVREEIAKEKEGWVTDPVIAHIPLRADLDFPRPFPDPDDPTSINIIYILTPTVDVKTNVSEGIVLPEGIVFVENNFPTKPITLSKGKTYKFRAKIKVVKPGRWIFYVSPGVYGDVSLFEEWKTGVQAAGVQGVFDATEPLIRYLHRERLSSEERDTLMNITKNWLRRHGAVKYEREEIDCTIISRPASGIKCCGCEMVCFSNSILYDRYYFIIEEDLVNNKTKVRNVYRWAYWTPSGFESKPVCEEITRTKNVKIGGD